jgi:hypothetical protein
MSKVTPLGGVAPGKDPDEACASPGKKFAPISPTSVENSDLIGFWRRLII